MALARGYEGSEVGRDSAIEVELRLPMRSVRFQLRRRWVRLWVLPRIVPCLAATRATDDVYLKSERPINGVSFSTSSELSVTALASILRMGLAL
jgi:hypothetical protein